MFCFAIWNKVRDIHSGSSLTCAARASCQQRHTLRPA